MLYALTYDKQILIFDMKQHGNKQDTLECKVIGKLELDSSLNYTIAPTRGGVLIQDTRGRFHFLNTSDLPEVIQNPTTRLL